MRKRRHKTFTDIRSHRHSVVKQFKMVLPVRIDWSTLRVVDLIEVSLMSAGTLSPTVDRNNNAQETLQYLFTI